MLVGLVVGFDMLLYFVCCDYGGVIVNCVV